MRHERTLTRPKYRAVQPVTRRASQELRGAGALLAASVLADSGSSITAARSTTGS